MNIVPISMLESEHIYRSRMLQLHEKLILEVTRLYITRNLGTHWLPWISAIGLVSYRSLQKMFHQSVMVEKWSSFIPPSPSPPFPSFYLSSFTERRISPAREFNLLCKGSRLIPHQNYRPLQGSLFS